MELGGGGAHGLWPNCPGYSNGQLKLNRSGSEEGDAPGGSPCSAGTTGAAFAASGSAKSSACSAFGMLADGGFALREADGATGLMKRYEDLPRRCHAAVFFCGLTTKATRPDAIAPFGCGNRKGRWADEETLLKH